MLPDQRTIESTSVQCLLWACSPAIAWDRVRLSVVSDRSFSNGFQGRCRWKRFVFLALVLAGLNATAAPAKRVLVVHSFVNAAPPFTTHSVAFETELTRIRGRTVD